ncbi:hypothetical protein D3C81_1064290 [compost metagenome]
MRHDRQGRAIELRQLDARRAFLPRGEHDGIAAGRDLVERHREGGPTVAREPAEPRRHRARRFQRRRRRRAGEHERQLQAPDVAAVEERQRQQRQVIGQRHRHDREFQHAAVADGGPQARMERVFAVGGVVPDQLQVEPVEFRDQPRLQRQLLLQVAAGRFARHGHGLRNLAVDQHVDVRDLRQQRGRVAVAQLQARTGDDLVRAHGKGHAVDPVHAAQLERQIRAELLERHRHDAAARAGSGSAGTGGSGHGRDGGNLLRRARLRLRRSAHSSEQGNDATGEQGADRSGRRHDSGEFLVARLGMGSDAAGRIKRRWCLQ